MRYRSALLAIRCTTTPAARMYRYTLGSFLRPDNGSTVQTVASLGVIGTGMLVP